jgi:hypothetical protein
MSRQQILDFQARWMRPAGIAAILGAALLVVSGVVGSVGSPDDTAEQLELYQDHAGRYVLASVISGVGLVLLTFPLYFVFRSALARSDRVRGFLGPLFVIGAVLVAVQGVLFSVGLKDASDRYVAGVSAVEAKARQEAAQAQQPQANPPAEDGRGGEGAATTTAPTATTTAATTTTGAAQPRTVDQRVSDAKDDFAEDEINDSSNVTTARLIGLVGGLALIGGAVYTLVWAMRTGLLTRFMATLGMVFIAALVVLPQLGPIGMILWFAILGLMLTGWWIRPLPPAWAAGEAIPWPRPGEDLGPQPEERPPGTVEGGGREVSEAPPPETGAAAEQPRETPGERRKKRKRRK